jgi:NitT/TauT family transport system substrate-binding protein
MEKRKNKETSRRDFLKGAVVLGAASAMGVGFPAVILSSTTADKNYTIKLGYYNCDHMTAAPVAYDAGIFEKLGLKVDMTGTGKVPEAMAAGQMDVGYIGFLGMLQAIEKGSPMVTVAHNHKGGSKYIVVTPHIKKPADLIGKKLGLGPSPEKRLGDWIRFAKETGIPVESNNYEVFAMADRDKYLALKTGKLDGYWCCDPWGSMAEYEKTGRILQAFGALPSGEWGICCTLVVNKDFMKDHLELVKKMIAAHSQAIQFIYTQPMKAARIFAKNYHVPEEVAMMTI